MDPVILALLVALGWAANVARSLRKASKAAGKLVTPWAEFRDHPYRCALSIMGAVAGGVSLYQLDELTPLTAIGMGFAADALFEWAAGIAERKIKR